MSRFQRDQDEEQGLHWGWKLGLGLLGAAVGGTLGYVAYEGTSYTIERHTHLKKCSETFVSAEELLLSGCLEYGDMIEFKRPYYQHWGIYVGNGMVVHVSDGGQVVEESLVAIGGGSTCRVNLLEWKAKRLQLYPRGSRRQIVAYAKEQVGKRIEYHIAENNCEHFVTECFYGQAFSSQQDILNGNTTARLVGIGSSRTYQLQ